MSTSEKVVGLEALVEELAPKRRDGRTVALANGLFDLLHVGHLRYLEGAAEEGDLLVVAINSDASARVLKGPTRPVVPETERAELVAGFGCVDHVVVFPETTVENVLRMLLPDVHCKGTDYTVETVPEAAITDELGIRVAIVGDAKTHATRDMIQRVRDERKS